MLKDRASGRGCCAGNTVRQRSLTEGGSAFGSPVLLPGGSDPSSVALCPVPALEASAPHALLSGHVVPPVCVLQVPSNGEWSDAYVAAVVSER